MRVFVFNKYGNLVDKTDSFRTADKTLSPAILYFSNADTLKMESQPDDASSISTWHKSPGAVFSRLAGLVPAPVHTLPAGPYLVVVYVDNALLHGPFSIVALPAKSGEESAAVLHTERSIVAAQGRLVALQEEHGRTKAAYEATLVRMRDEEDLADALLLTREDVYRCD